MKYIICDIVPAIYISYKRLKLAFPNKNISLLVDENDKTKLNEISNIFNFNFNNFERNIGEIIFNDRLQNKKYLQKGEKVLFLRKKFARKKINSSKR